MKKYTIPKSHIKEDMQEEMKIIKAGKAMHKDDVKVLKAKAKGKKK